MKTDLERFIDLYKSFGIDCVVEPDNNEGFKIEFCADEDFYSNSYETRSSLFEGYFGFYSSIHFDTNGNFIKQGFWE